MPSLRERSSRPNYSLMAGVPGLSDDETSGDSPAAQGSASSSKTGRNRKDDAESGSESSGGSTAFQPATKSGKKGTHKRKGKGKGRAVHDDDSGSEFEAGSDGEADEDDEEDEDDQAGEMDLDEKGDESEDEPMVELVDDDDDKPTKSRPKPSGGRSSNTKGWTGPRSAQTAYVQTEVNMIPQPYRALIKSKAESMGAVNRPPPNAAAGHHKNRQFSKEQLPFGPSTPFITRLSREPRGRELDEVYVDRRLGDEEDWEGRKATRQDRSAQVIRHVTLIDPWQVWQGEGWWPEMATKHGPKREIPPSGHSRISHSTARHHWTMRQDVRLGLDKVGRYNLDQMEFLDPIPAAQYLPSTRDTSGSTAIPIHLGMYGKQSKIDFPAFEGHTLNRFNPTADGFVFSAGGPIWGLDWCPYPAHEAAKNGGTQYLAVSPMPHIDYKSAMGSRCPAHTAACVQIWGVTPPRLDDAGVTIEAASIRCELVLCIKGGPAVEVKWMPMGAWDADGDSSRIPKLGILAAVQLDGSASLYAVPHPRYLHSRAQSQFPNMPLCLEVDSPLLKLDISDAMCTTLEWLSGTRVMVGLSNGHLATWDVLDALRSPITSAPLPGIYLSVAQSSVKTLAIGRVPPIGASGEYDYTGDPIYVVAGAYDGTACVVDLRDTESVHHIISTRMPITAVGWSTQLGVPIWADPDYVVQLHSMRGLSQTISHFFAFHRGPIWSVSTSEYHTMCLTASADGSAILSNLQAGWFRRRGAGITHQRLFEMDYDEHTGEYRMLDNFATEDISIDYALQKNSSKAKGTAHPLEGNPIVIKTGNWSPHVGVHRSCWNNNGGLGKAGWIASGTASGIGRVDILHGRFTQKGGVPRGL